MSREISRLVSKVSKSGPRIGANVVRDVLQRIGKCEANHIYAGRTVFTAPTSTIKRLARIELQKESRVLKTKKGNK